MQKLRFSLNISAEKIQRYYEGSAKAVHVVTDDGRTLEFPITAIQKFVTHAGIQGHFEIVFDDQFKLVELNKIV